MSWPALRSRPITRTEIGIGTHVAAAVISLVLMILGGYALNLVIEIAPGAAGSGGWQILALFSLIFIFGPIFGWVGFLIGLPLAIWLFAQGWGGWMVISLAGLVVGAVLSAVAGMGGAAPITGACLAAIYWLVLRLMRPGAFHD